MSLLKRATADYAGVRVEMRRTRRGMLVAVKEWIDGRWVETQRVEPKGYIAASRYFEYEVRQLEEDGWRISYYMRQR